MLTCDMKKKMSYFKNFYATFTVEKWKMLKNMQENFSNFHICIKYKDLAFCTMHSFA